MTFHHSQGRIWEGMSTQCNLPKAFWGLMALEENLEGNGRSGGMWEAGKYSRILVSEKWY